MSKRFFGSLLALVLCAACSGNPIGPSTTGKPTSTTPITNPPAPAPAPTPTPGVPGAWSETFTGGLSNRWTVSEYVGIGNTIFTRSNVDFTDGLRLALTQERNGDGSALIVHGAEVQSTQRYGYGTYTWVFRGDPVSGSTSALFSFFQNSTTEIDFEQEGQHPGTEHCVMFHNGRNISLQDANVGDSLWTAFRSYSFTWTPGSVVWKVDGQIVATQTDNVPTEPGYIVMNHWGSLGSQWGGPATYGTSFMTVQSFSFTPN